MHRPLNIELDPEKIRAQQDRLEYLANRKIIDINCDYLSDDNFGKHSCTECLHWDDRRQRCSKCKV